MLPDGRIFLPWSLGHVLIKDLHDSTHLGPTKLHLAQDLTTRYSVCQQANQKGPPLAEPGMRMRGPSLENNGRLISPRSSLACMVINICW
jgi:hypothetical protein